MTAVVLTAANACQKQDSVPMSDNDNAVRFDVAGVDVSIDTKADVDVTDVSDLNASGFKASATTGAAGSEVSAWNNVTFSKTGTYFEGGKLWPDSDPSYHFYASNVAITHNGNGCTVAATNATDVVCAYLASSTFETPNTLTFNHIFARIGNVTVSAVDGYTITNVHVSITPKTGGTYNIRTGNGQTNGTGWSSLTTGSATELANTTPGTKSNDLYLVPGSYDLAITWTAAKGTSSNNYSNTVTGVSIVGGKINSITLGLTGSAVDIQFAISVTDWGSATNAVGTVAADAPEIEKPFYFECLTAGQISFYSDASSSIKTVEYSKDGVNWTSVTSTTSTSTSPKVSMAVGDILYIRGNNSCYNDNGSGEFGFYGSTGYYNLGGNIMSLISSTNFQNLTTIPSQYCFNRMFMSMGSADIISAEKLVLPATTLTTRCYEFMFMNRTRMTHGPKIMATTLANYCCQRMFMYCSSLTAAPELPATTLVTGCYSSMFAACTKLNYVKAMFTTTPSSSYTGDWLEGVASNGTFVKNSSASWNVSGTSGVPSGWTVQTASN